MNRISTVSSNETARGLFVWKQRVSISIHIGYHSIGIEGHRLLTSPVAIFNGPEKFGFIISC